jgi:catechol 2,3-dioxygenase-like lactoylglutathione lyase family enzyme
VTRARCVCAALALAAAAAWPSASQIEPVDLTIYRRVAHLGWVVRDADATSAAWRSLGVNDIVDLGVREFPATYRGRAVTARVKTVQARFANGAIQWIQPIGDGTAYADFLARHGEGVQHVAFEVTSRAQLERELARYRALGVGVLHRADGAGPSNAAASAYLDTANDGGGMTVALEHQPTTLPASRVSNDEPFSRITQYAFVVRDLRRVSAYYERLGLGALPFDLNVSLDRVYRGGPGTFEMLLGWGRWADVAFEWIQPTVGPSTYDEHLERHGEGFHHLGFNVSDMDAAVARLRARGLAVTMSGGWDSGGNAGRFAYLDAERHGGVAVELLWNKPK